MATDRRVAFADQNVQDAWDLAVELIADAQERDRMWDDLDALYYNDREMTGASGTPDHADPLGIWVTSGTRETSDLGQRKAAAELDLGVNLVSSLDPVVAVPASSPSRADVSDADEREAWLNAYIKQAEREERGGVVRSLAFHGFQRGLLVLRVIARQDRLKRPGEERPLADRLADAIRRGVRPSRAAGYEQGELLPIQLQVRDPRQVYPRWTEDGLAAVVEEYERKWRDVKEHHPEAADLAGSGSGDTVIWREYWDREWVIYWAGQSFVTRRRHGLGVVPYAIRIPIQAGSDEPSRAVRPFLKNAQGLAQRINRLVAIQETTAVRYNNDALIVSGRVSHDGAGGTKVPGLSLDPFTVNVAEEGTRVDWIYRSKPPLETDSLLALYLSEWESATWPKEMHGAERVARSGLAWGLMTEAGRVRMVPVLSGMEQVLEDALGLVLRTAEQVIGPLVGGAVHVQVVEAQDLRDRRIRVARQVEIRTEEIDGSYRVEVKLGTPASAEQLQRALLAERMVGAGILSRQTAAEEYMGVASWAEERERLAREAAAQDPQVRQIEAALARIETIRELRERVEEMQLTPEEMAMLPPELGGQPQAPPPEDLRANMPAGPQGLPPELGGQWGALAGPGVPGMEGPLGYPQEELAGLGGVPGLGL